MAYIYLMKVQIVENSISLIIEKNQANGRYYFTLNELVNNFTGTKPALQEQLKRLL